jgi:membrane protease YdiL (CAAX protease family)
VTISAFVRSRPLLSFSLLTYGISWSLGVVLYAYLQTTGTPANVTQAGPVALSILFLAGAFASIAGIVMTLIVGGRAGMQELLTRLKRWRASMGWYAAAMLTTSIAAGAALALLAATISLNFQPAIWREGASFVAILFALFFGLMFGLLEEFGWAGFVLPRLLARYPAFSAALRLGIIWALWHALLVLWVWPTMPSSNLAVQIGGGVIWMAALVPYRILMSWVYINTKSSLLMAIIMHAFYDASLAILVPVTLSPVEALLFYAALNVALWVAVAAVVVLFGARTMERAQPRFKLDAAAASSR